MVPVGVVAKCVAVKPGVIEIAQTVEILRYELVVSKLVVSELTVTKLIVGGKRVTTSVCETVIGHPSSTTGHCVIVTEVMGSELMTAAAQGVTSKSMSVVGVSREAMRAQCTTTPPMTNVGHATMGSKSMKSTASAMPSATPAVKPGKPTAPAVKSTAPTPMPASATAMPASATTPTAMPGDCRGVRDDAKRANRNAGRKNAYCSLLHGVFPSSGPKRAGLQRSRADLPISNCCLRHEFLDGEIKLCINFRQSLRRNKRPPVSHLEPPN
jgi:hypothetical protein